MELETMRPNPVWDADSYGEAIAIFESWADDIVVKVWGGDWCKDCRSRLPDFGAAMEAAGVEAVEHYPVEKADDGSKVGPEIDAYGIELIPTVIVEDAESGEELARFVENADEPIVVHLAEQLDA
ncbi:MAG: thioredoxin [Natronomonas sp.]|uniref:TlpA family protein disulfide reductase n=1 Tax=Natronomonas sp. TaxID=2184060 RepID=UPI00286FBEBA|nr:thioredoxin [Natronomonas sp.]MDR9430508.1 thioredoxin [Natronomonas sp.]